LNEAFNTVSTGTPESRRTALMPFRKGGNGGAFSYQHHR